MTIEIKRTLSESGRRTLWFPTADGKRITWTNYARKWEAVKLAKLYIELKSTK